MSVASLAASLIRLAEGLRLSAYQDSGGVWTIAYGHTEGVKQGDTCTVAQAEAWLAEDAAPLFTLVADKPLVAAAAYVDFGYDCGYHSLQLVLGGTAQMGDYVHDRHGNVLAGLEARRGLELALIEAA